MAFDELLDDNKLQKNLQLWECIKWWEQRRLKYNLTVGAVGLCMSIYILINTAGSHSLYGLLVGLGLMYAFVANVAYLLGWVIELLVNYYFEISFNTTIRSLLYWAGIGCSILPLLTIIAF